jgi:small ligand-binding sensory domain FIST
VGLNGETPLAFLERLDHSLSPEDRTLLRQALFLGIAVPEDGPRGDGNAYLIRNLMDIDHARGGLWIGARLEEGMRVRFHLRDSAASRDDLGRLLDLSLATSLQPPHAALMFSCLGRGANLYGRPHHDVGLVEERIPRIPVAGFFCSGEIGPVAGQTLLHGYTAAMALVRPLRG